MKINFNKPHITGTEYEYIADAISTGKISGNGKYTTLCQDLVRKTIGIKKTLLTTSCTDALEMSAILSNFSIGDEVIIPSYTFVSTALAFVREKAKIVFADSETMHPNIDVKKIQELITPKTKAIVAVHYAGISCDMEELTKVAKDNNLLLIEDAAQAIGGKFKSINLGSIGDFATFSFHETKNIQCGEGGLLSINNEKYMKRAEIIWEKGTNRAEFFRGEVNKYEWVDIGSSFLPSEISAAFLYAQLRDFENIMQKRIEIWNHYYARLFDLHQKGHLKLPYIPVYASNPAHMFYIELPTLEVRDNLKEWLNKNSIQAVTHYLTLHRSPYYSKFHDGRILENSEKFENCLLRLPLFYDLSKNDIDFVCDSIQSFFEK